MHVIGRGQRHIQVAGNRQQPFVHHELILDALILHLEEHIAVAENVAELRRRFERLPLAPQANFRRDFAFEAAAEADQSPGVLRQQLLINTRLVIEAFGVARRHELDQVVITLIGFSQQHEMVRGLADRAALGVAAARGDIDLAPKNRFHTALPGVIVKDDRRKHVAVLGHRQRRHLQPGGLIEQLVDAAGAIEQRVLGVQMKMNESLIGHC